MAPRHRRYIDDMTMDRWIRAGIIRVQRLGPGRSRKVTDDEMRAIAAVDSVRRLAGTAPTSEAYTPSVRALMVVAAEAARTNPPGTIVELASKSPHVRHILVVPEV